MMPDILCGFSKEVIGYRDIYSTWAPSFMSGLRCYSSSLRFEFYLFGKLNNIQLLYNMIWYDDDDPRCCLCTNTQETKQVYMLHNVWNIVDITPKVEIEMIWDAFNLVWGISFGDGLVLIFPPQLTPLNSAPPDKPSYYISAIWLLSTTEQYRSHQHQQHA